MQSMLIWYQVHAPCILFKYDAWTDVVDCIVLVLYCLHSIQATQTSVLLCRVLTNLLLEGEEKRGREEVKRLSLEVESEQHSCPTAVVCSPTA